MILHLVMAGDPIHQLSETQSSAVKFKLPAGYISSHLTVEIGKHSTTANFTHFLPISEL